MRMHLNPMTDVFGHRNIVWTQKVWTQKHRTCHVRTEAEIGAYAATNQVMPRTLGKNQKLERGIVID